MKWISGLAIGILLSQAVAPPQAVAGGHEASEALPVLVRPDGTYPTKPLEKDVIVLKVVQSGVDSLADFATPQEGLQANLDRMLGLARQACSQGKKPDILLYHEFPLTGYFEGTREEKLRFTVSIPGPETDALGAMARECDTYIIFGSYAVEPDWPDHIISLNTVIDRQGEVVKKFWKSRNIKRLYPDREIMTTTIEGVRDKYRAMYGIEEEFPVLQTEFGNIAVSTVQLDPFVFAAFAMRGVEIMLRTATLFSEEDVLYTARANNFYSAMSNITIPPGTPFTESGGLSMIVSPDGEVLDQDPRHSEEGIVEAEIPIADFRKGRRIPNFALKIVEPVFDQYVEEFPINHLDMPKEELPKTGAEMKAMMESKSQR